MLCCPVRVVPVSCFPCSTSRVPNSLITGQVGSSQPCPGRLHSHLFFPFSLQLSPPLLASAPLLPSCLSSPALFCASRQACLDPSCRRLRRITFVRYYFDSFSLVPCHLSVKHTFLFNFFFFFKISIFGLPADNKINILFSLFFYCLAALRVI